MPEAFFDMLALLVRWQNNDLLFIQGLVETFFHPLLLLLGPDVFFEREVDLPIGIVINFAMRGDYDHAMVIPRHVGQAGEDQTDEPDGPPIEEHRMADDGNLILLRRRRVGMR